MAAFALRQALVPLLDQPWLRPADVTRRLDVVEHAFGALAAATGQNDVVGFAADAGKRELFLTQLFLAPRRVLRNAGGVATVGVYQNPDAQRLEDLRARGFQPIASAPPYVLLLRK